MDMILSTSAKRSLKKALQKTVLFAYFFPLVSMYSARTGINDRSKSNLTGMVVLMNESKSLQAEIIWTLNAMIASSIKAASLFSVNCNRYESFFS